MNYYNLIKEELVKSEITKRVKKYSINKSELNTYYSVGKYLYEAGKHYGEGIVKSYSKKLTDEIGKGYSVTNLKYMRLFYLFQKSQQSVDFLPWGHYTLLLALKDTNKIKYYISRSINDNLSRKELKEIIQMNEYERLNVNIRNKIVNKNELDLKEVIPNPIFIKNNYNKEVLSEKILQHLIMEDIPSFLKSLGSGFTFIENEYKIKIGDRYNYIDLLLFNYKYNCFVVVELKITELKKEHIGQIEVYMNYIDKNIKNINHDKTMGIILVKKDNKLLMEYCSDSRIMSRSYVLI